MGKIIECVPNFSEGRDQTTIDAIADAIRETPGCRLLDIDSGWSTHRTVYTFVGDPDAVVVGALNAARTARDRIDMRRHSGEHPRMGALDVCPFIPITDVTMDECVSVARRFAEEAAETLQVPVYLYEEAARQDYRKKLSQIRLGEYEGLVEKLKDSKWTPDFGPTDFVPEWGATTTGARPVLIAYNVNILGTPNQAHRIALNLRDAGRGSAEPGRLTAVKGMGWFVDEINAAQVTVNLTNYRITPPHVLFEEVKQEAAALNVGVAGSEIVGLVPLEAMLMAADYYIEQEDLFIYEEDQKIRLAMDRLGLHSVSPFVPEEKIIEYMVAEPVEEPLAGGSVRSFIEAIAARTSAPGGGSASAMMTAIGTALGAMVAKLTYGVRKFEDVDPQMRKVIPILHEITQRLIPMIDTDTEAFHDVMSAIKMPKNTKEEKAARKAKIQAGLKSATEVPLMTMKLADRAWDPLCEVARHGNPASKSDVQVAAKALDAGIWGAHQNVLINLEDVEDKKYKTAMISDAQTLAARASEKLREVLELLDRR